MRVRANTIRPRSGRRSCRAPPPRPPVSSTRPPPPGGRGHGRAPDPPRRPPRGRSWPVSSSCPSSSSRGPSCVTRAPPPAPLTGGLLFREGLPAFAGRGRGDPAVAGRDRRTPAARNRPAAVARPDRTAGGRTHPRTAGRQHGVARAARQCRDVQRGAQRAAAATDHYAGASTCGEARAARGARPRGRGVRAPNRDQPHDPHVVAVIEDGARVPGLDRDRSRRRASGDARPDHEGHRRHAVAGAEHDRLSPQQHPRQTRRGAARDPWSSHHA